MQSKWMIYGAYGFTGEWLAKQAVAQQMNPIIAGRDALKTKRLAIKLGLEFRTFSIEDDKTIEANLKDIDLLYNLAGPYCKSAPTLVEACLRTKTHYMDLTGDLEIYDFLYSLDRVAKESGILIMPGVGFNIIATECVAAHTAQKLSHCDTLDIVMATQAKPSKGTFKQMIALLPKGGYEIKDSSLHQCKIEKSDIIVNFPHKKRTAFKIPIGELVACYKSMEIPNIRVYYALSSFWASLAESMLYSFSKFYGKRYGKKLLSGIASTYAKGPSENSMLHDKAFVYAKASSSKDGVYAETMIKTPEPYLFTVLIALKAITKVLDSNYKGAMTPLEAFGSSFVFDVEGVEYV